MEKLEVVRNKIAHSQSSIGRLSWEHITRTVSKAEEFVSLLDDEIEAEGKEKAKYFESTVLVPVAVV